MLVQMPQLADSWEAAFPLSLPSTEALGGIRARSLVLGSCFEATFPSPACHARGRRFEAAAPQFEVAGRPGHQIEDVRIHV